MSYKIRSRRNSDGTTHVELWYTRHTDGAETFSGSVEAPAHIEVLDGETRPGQQNSDGGVHLTHYDRDNLLSYVWDGVSEVIEVSHGGYAEPVFGVIPLDPEIIEAVLGTQYDDDGAYVNDTIAIFREHVIRDEEEGPSAACPECGAEPDQVEQAAEVVNNVVVIDGAKIHADHKEWFPEGDYTLRCPLGHTYSVPDGVEVVL